MYPIEKYKFKTYEQKNEDGTISTVVTALTTYAGKTVKGVAKCLQSDEFDLEVGKQLAAARCDYKVCMKRNRRATSKLIELTNTLDRVNKYFDKAFEYSKDATNEVLKSIGRLNDLENKLK